MEHTGRAAARTAGWFVAFVVAGYAGRASSLGGPELSLIWPAAGVAMLWLHGSTGRARRLDVLALTVATLLVNISTGSPLLLAGFYVLTNVGQVLLFLLLGHRWVPHVVGFGGTRPLCRLGEFGRLAFAALIACGVVALVGTIGLAVTDHDVDLIGYCVWWGRNTAGMVAIGLTGLLLGPDLVADGHRATGVLRRVARGFVPRSFARGVEASLLIGLTAVIYGSTIAFGEGQPVAFVLLIPTFWVGIRFVPSAVALHSVLMGGAVLAATLLGLGPFMSIDDLGARAVAAQVFVIMIVVAGLCLAFTTATERQATKELAHLASLDPLTGLANRRTFERELSAHLTRYRRHGVGGAVLMLDLDRFKNVNDTLGHLVGDQLLIRLSRALDTRVRDTDVIARLGGDEFAILLAGADLEAAERVAADVVALVRSTVADLDPVQSQVTVSIGGVVFDRDDTGVTVLAAADTMLYDAKDSGRDQWAVHDRRADSDVKGAVRELWSEQIDRALADDAFELHLQPIMNMSSGRVTGAEALLRMRLDGELVLPGQFLPAAERDHSVVRLDRWVLRHAVPLLAQLQQVDPSFRLSVNLSALSLSEPSVEDELRRALREHAVDPAGLLLEMTETAAVTRIREARDFIERTRPLGCGFALDDFGAGFSSFYYLKHLPFDVVKIDGEFVSACSESATDRVIVSSMAQMAARLGKQSVAEFVADGETLELIESLGVDFAQGHHVGRPVPVAEFVATMEDGLDDGLGESRLAEF